MTTTTMATMAMMDAARASIAGEIDVPVADVRVSLTVDRHGASWSIAVRSAKRPEAPRSRAWQWSQESDADTLSAAVRMACDRIRVCSAGGLWRPAPRESGEAG
jgi:hypothetical protein